MGFTAATQGTAVLLVHRQPGTAPSGRGAASGGPASAPRLQPRLVPVPSVQGRGASFWEGTRKLPGRQCSEGTEEELSGWVPRPPARAPRGGRDAPARTGAGTRPELGRTLLPAAHEVSRERGVPAAVPGERPPARDSARPAGSTVPTQGDSSPSSHRLGFGTSRSCPTFLPGESTGALRGCREEVPRRSARPPQLHPGRPAGRGGA